MAHFRPYPVSSCIGVRLSISCGFHNNNYTIGICSPVLARLSDLTGKKKHIIAVCCLFGVAGAIVGGKATSMQMVIAGQVLIGIAISCVGVTS